MRQVLSFTYFILLFHCSAAVYSQTQQIPVSVTVINHSEIKSDSSALIRANATITNYTDSSTVAMMRNAAYLENLSGNYYIYNTGPDIVTVKRNSENTLSIVLPGQGEYDLIPRIPILFDVKGLQNVKILFLLDDLGKAHSINIIDDGLVKKHVNALKK